MHEHKTLRTSSVPCNDQPVPYRLQHSLHGLALAVYTVLLRLRFVVLDGRFAL